jgi:tetratricopeptide (TPR) repeat protein
MGFQYRKSIKVMPGVRLTASKSGLSASVGGKGARVTKSTSGRTTKTVGIPGTGLRHTTSSSSKSSQSKAQPAAAAPAPKPGALAPKGEKALYKAIQSQDVQAVDAVTQTYAEYALVASTIAGLMHASQGNTVRAEQLLGWVFSTQKDPAEDAFFRKYVGGHMNVEIATGVTAELPIDRQSVGLILAEIRQADGNVQGATDVVESLEPTALAAVSLAELYTDADRFDDVVDLTNGISNEDDATAILLVFRGHAFRMLGQFTAAREALRDALKSSKRESAILQRALVERAYAYLGEGKPAQAKKDAEKLMAQDRSHPLLPDLLAAIDPDGSTSAATPTLPPPTLPPPSV